VNAADIFDMVSFALCVTLMAQASLAVLADRWMSRNPVEQIIQDDRYEEIPWYVHECAWVRTRLLPWLEHL
jgi:hypothetical protein